MSFSGFLLAHVVVLSDLRLLMFLDFLQTCYSSLDIPDVLMDPVIWGHLYDTLSKYGDTNFMGTFFVPIKEKPAKPSLILF